MTLLEISQIILNFTLSVVILLVGVLISLVVLGTMRFVKSIKKFIENINQESTELYKRLNNFLEGISNLSFISRFFKKKKSK